MKTVIYPHETVRVGRKNGHARAAIVKEPNARCWVVMKEIGAYGNLATARARATEQVLADWPDTAPKRGPR